MMEITTRDYKRANVIRVVGEINANTASQLEAKLNEYIETGHFNLILELDGVNFLSSAGIRTIITGQRGAKEHNGALFVAQPSENVREVFNLAGLEVVLPVYDTTEQALGEI
jgi:anti-anti-sigma factor